MSQITNAFALFLGYSLFQLLFHLCHLSQFLLCCHRTVHRQRVTKCFQYLFGDRAILLYRILFVLAVPVGAMAKLDFIWLVADTFNAMMAIPNLIALALLSPVVFKLTRDYFAGKTVLPGEALEDRDR